MTRSVGGKPFPGHRSGYGNQATPHEPEGANLPDFSARMIYIWSVFLTRSAATGCEGTLLACFHPIRTIGARRWMGVELRCRFSSNFEAWTAGAAESYRRDPGANPTTLADLAKLRLLASIR